MPRRSFMPHSLLFIIVFDVALGICAQPAYASTLR